VFIARDHVLCLLHRITYCVYCTGSRAVFTAMYHVLCLLHCITYCVYCTGSRTVFTALYYVLCFSFDQSLSSDCDLHLVHMSNITSPHTQRLSYPQASISTHSSPLIIKIIQMGAFPPSPSPDPRAPAHCAYALPPSDVFIVVSLLRMRVA
jgi:hypothetical protein